MDEKDVEAVAKAVEIGQRNERDKRNLSGCLGVIVLFMLAPVAWVFTGPIGAVIVIVAGFIGISKLVYKRKK